MLYIGLPLLVCSSGYLVFVILEIGRTEAYLEKMLKRNAI